MNTLNKTKSIINKFNIRANKRYGQNFLIDDNILENIVSSSNIGKEDLVIEIGPGLGNLTEYILQNCKYALLVEIDPKMIEVLEYRFNDRNNFKLVNEDICFLFLELLFIKFDFLLIILVPLVYTFLIYFIFLLLFI